MLTKTIAPIFIRVKMYIPVSLLSFLIINLVAIAPNTDPKGKIPIRRDWVEKGSKVMLYSCTIFLMGMEVISFKL